MIQLKHWSRKDKNILILYSQINNWNKIIHNNKNQFLWINQTTQCYQSLYHLKSKKILQFLKHDIFHFSNQTWHMNTTTPHKKQPSTFQNGHRSATRFEPSTTTTPMYSPARQEGQMVTEKPQPLFTEPFLHAGRHGGSLPLSALVRSQSELMLLQKSIRRGCQLSPTEDGRLLLVHTRTPSASIRVIRHIGVV